MKTQLFLLPLGCIFLAGCVNTYGLNEEQVEQAYDKYASWYVLKSDDTCAETTGKVIFRSLIGVISLSLFENTAVPHSKSHACHMMYLDTFIGKTKHDVILAFGAPDKRFDDGNGGEVIAYEEFEIYGDQNSVHSELKKTNFFINKKGTVYKRHYEVK